MITYAGLPLIAVPNNAHATLPSKIINRNINLDSPAELLFTDLRNGLAITVPHTTHIDHGLEYMKYTGVRLLFVVDSDSVLLGYITAHDIIGEKPMLYLQKACEGPAPFCSRGDILVSHLMLPVADWVVFNYALLPSAKIGDVIESFKKTGERHLIVIEETDQPNAITVRGLFSATHIEFALDTRIETLQVPRNFAEIKHSLAHP